MPCPRFPLLQLRLSGAQLEEKRQAEQEISELQEVRWRRGGAA